MYSYEARIRAAELYIKLGKRVRPTIRQLGCWRRLKIEPPCRLNFEPRQMAIRSLRGRKTSSIPKTGPPHHVLADERVLMAGYRA